MSFLDQALSNDMFISVRGRLQQKLVTRLTKLTIDLIHHGVQEVFRPVNDNGLDEVWVNTFSKIEFEKYSSSPSTISIVSCSSKTSV